MLEKIIEQIAQETSLQAAQIGAVLEMLEKGSTPPFIARYRRDQTGGITEDQIAGIRQKLESCQALAERKQTVLDRLKEQNIAAPELEAQIQAATVAKVVDDLYLPYRPKRRTQATQAKNIGLDPLAVKIMARPPEVSDPAVAAQEFVNPEKEVKDVDDAIAGARHIVAEQIAESVPVRERVRNLIRREGRIVSSRNPSGGSSDSVRDFSPYFDFSQQVKSISHHQVLALNRGERTKILRVRIELPLLELARQIGELYLSAEDLDAAIKSVPPDLMATDGTKKEGTEELAPFRPRTVFEFMVSAIYDSIRRLLLPPLAREIRRDLTNDAEAHALELSCRNVRSMLMGAPTKGKAVMAISSGYRQGCKIVVLSAEGSVLESAIVYPHEPLLQVDEAKKILKDLFVKNDVKLVVIGDATAARETEGLIAKMIEEGCEGLEYCVTSSAGANAYSTSKLAKEELPGKDTALRATISLGRRVQDPLKELVKIDPKSLDTRSNTHDIPPKKLREALREVVESCVNQVGVDVNTASSSLLRYVSGLNMTTSKSIAQRRQEIGKFTSRDQLKEVPGIGDDILAQCSGFLRIYGGTNPLDATGIHPQNYDAARACLEEIGFTPEDVLNDEKRPALIEKIKSADLDKLAAKSGVGALTLQSILEDLKNPSADPRDNLPKPIFRNKLLKIEDLHTGDTCMGTVRNVVDYGAFVDIGVEEDGFVHVSELSDGYVRSALDVVTIGEVVEVRIIRIDTDRNRIALSMRKPAPKKPRRGRPFRRDQQDRESDPQAEKQATPASPEKSANPESDASKEQPAYQRPQSTLGTGSRRVQRAALMRPLSKTDQTILMSKPDVQETENKDDQQRDKDGLKGVLGKLKLGSVEKRGEQK
ncbi:MAG TPA: Tex-like N-terminal domain-containing protein [Candidatus Brocadiia bacterium]|nr:Tex-like N-terminal domain-containing protein [Candidatus Brocadiia bacterium]